MRKLEQQFRIEYGFPVYFGRHLLDPAEPLLASIPARAGRRRHRLLCIIDSGLLAARPELRDELKRYAAHHAQDIQLCGPPLVIAGGEDCKLDRAVVDLILDRIRAHRLCRQSFVLAIGGGAVLDAAGFATAIAHRGLRLIRMPTTVLAQNDAGIGVKNGINSMGRKNFIGAFAPPFAVLNDFNLLSTLPARQMRSGMAEAVKVALIKDHDFFNYLFRHRRQLASFATACMEEMIYRCAALHMHHIGSQGDPFEQGSARPLDFGHWSAHKLEEMTGGRLQHGEAVAVGCALDTLYSLRAGMLPEHEQRQIFTLLADLGLPLYHPALHEVDIVEALHEFQEHLGGNLALTLLTGIGAREEMTDIDIPLMDRCRNELAHRYSEHCPSADLDNEVVHFLEGLN